MDRGYVLPKYREMWGQAPDEPGSNQTSCSHRVSSLVALKAEIYQPNRSLA